MKIGLNRNFIINLKEKFKSKKVKELEKYFNIIVSEKNKKEYENMKLRVEIDKLKNKVELLEKEDKK